MLSRRELIGKAAVGAAATLAVSAAGVASARALQGATEGAAGADGRQPGVPDGHDPGNATPVTPMLPPPWELLRPLGAGAALAHGWRLVDLSPLRHGSAVVMLENARGRTRRIHLCRNDGSPQGIVYTRRVDLVVMNEGNGDLPTEEGLAQAVAALAHVIAANEGQVPGSLFAELVPHTERVQRFASADGPSAYGRLR